MQEKITFRTIWHEAGINALILAAVCIAYFLLSTTASTDSPTWLAIIINIAQIAKLVLCIWLMRYFMLRFKNEHPEADRADLRKLGYTIGLLSGAVLSAATMAYYQWHPEIITTVFDTVVSSSPDVFDRNALDILEKIEASFPQISFFSSMFYCTIWAFILPSILAPKLISDNPFNEAE